MLLMLCLKKKKKKVLKFGSYVVDTWVFIVLICILVYFLKICHNLKKVLELPEVTVY